MPPYPDSAHEGVTLLTALFSKRALTTGIALIDGDLPTWL